MRPLAKFIVEQSVFNEAYVDPLRTDVAQEDDMRQEIARMVVALGKDALCTILMDMNDSICHASAIISFPGQKAVTINAHDRQPDVCVSKLSEMVFSTLLPESKRPLQPSTKLRIIKDENII